MTRVSLLTVVETPSFLRDAKKLLDYEERETLVNYLSATPYAGDLIKGTGGIRKIRWMREGAGKRGAYRVIYFFHSAEIPLFMLNIFEKSEKTSIDQAERNELKQLTGMLIKQYKSKRIINEWKTNH
ncbi:MAG: type II toxin-antitoxin system RelE/ParE family toxin [Treponema sp.]|nr:type II toxin-antitoxin system RelE/ParE family toxin [Treponema sp.]